MKSMRSLLLVPVGLTILITACSQPGAIQTDKPEPSLSTQATTVDRRVGSGTDVAEEYNGTVYFNSPVLELGEKTPGTVQYTGLRFTNVAIPQGAEIVDAYLEFNAVTSQSGTTTLTAYGDDAGNAGVFGSGTSSVTARTSTSAVASWSVSPWTDGGIYKTPSLAAVIEEITNRTDWTSGNAMAFVVYGNGLRKAQSYNATNGLVSPRLVISYNASTKFKPDLSMTIKSNFSLAALQAYDQTNGTDAAVWYQRLISSTGFTQAVGSTYNFTSSTNGSGPLRVMAREVNQDISTLLLAFRMTGDPAILNRVRDIMNLALDNLDNDGSYLAWSLNPASSTFADNQLEEALAYGAVAQAAYAFYLNRNVSSSYNSLYLELKDLFRNNFEKRYEGSGGYNGGSVTDDDLFHPYVSMTRYYWYMHLMLKNSSVTDEANDANLYKAEADRKGDVILRMMNTDSANNTYVWSHRVWPEGFGDCSLVSGSTYKCAYQMSQYPQETAGGFSGLLMDGFEKVANNAFAHKLARSYNLNVFNGSTFSGGWNDAVMSSDVGRDNPTPCPGTCTSVTTSSSENHPTTSAPITLQYVNASGTKGEVRHAVERNMALLGIWDDSTTQQVPSKLETYYNGLPTSRQTAYINAPSILLANELYRKGAYSLD